MNLNEYQQKALDTAQYPPVGTGPLARVIYPLIGLSGEVGEVSEKIKKIIRDKSGFVSHENKVVIQAEIGDVLWYVAVLADSLGLKLEDIAQGNISKLASRKERNVIHGDGDVR